MTQSQLGAHSLDLCRWPHFVPPGVVTVSLQSATFQSMADLAVMLFHSSGLLYEDGETITPGNWGRVILGAGPPHPRFYAEHVIESIRRLEFADKPSRIRSAFAFEGRDYASSGWRNDREHVYRVEPADANASSHRGDMAWIDAMGEQHTFEEVEACVRRYWTGEQHPAARWEIATVSDLVVVERVG